MAVLDKISGAAPNDHLSDVDEGTGTFLNTKEWKYASFFNRVKQSVGMHWTLGPKCACAIRAERSTEGATVTPCSTSRSQSGVWSRTSTSRRAAASTFSTSRRCTRSRGRKPFPTAARPRRRRRHRALLVRLLPRNGGRPSNAPLPSKLAVATRGRPPPAACHLEASLRFAPHSVGCVDRRIQDTMASAQLRAGKSRYRHGCRSSPVVSGPRSARRRARQANRADHLRPAPRWHREEGDRRLR